MTHFRGRVADMRPNRLSEEYGAEFNDVNDFSQFVKVVYQIRCNIFHGNKSDPGSNHPV